MKSPFIDIYVVDPSIEIELKYTTADNITGKPQYPRNMKARLRIEVVYMLAEAQRYLKEKYGPEFSLRVYDAGRPEYVQRDMYEWCKENGKE
jgi:zinc D-Ala-D-Ala dipeptidase